MVKTTFKEERKMKTHYVQATEGNESNPNDECGSTLCGLEETESQLDNDIKNVNCKTCLKIYPKYREYLKDLFSNFY